MVQFSDLVSRRHLHVVAAARGAAHAAQCKAALGVGVDEFVRHGWHVGQHAQPAKGVHALVGFEQVGRGAGAAHAVVAIAARDEVTGQRVGLAVLFGRHARVLAIKVVHLHVLRVVHGGQARRCAGIHQVAGHFSLAVHRHAAAAGQLMQVDAVALALEQQLDAVMRQAIGMGAGAHACLVQQVHADLLQHPGADAAEHVVGAALLDDDGVNARLVEQLTEQQAGGAGTNDGNLGAHGKPLGMGCGEITRTSGFEPRLIQIKAISGADDCVRSIDALCDDRAVSGVAGVGNSGRHRTELLRGSASPCAPGPSTCNSLITSHGLHPHRQGRFH